MSNPQDPNLPQQSGWQPAAPQNPQVPQAPQPPAYTQPGYPAQSASQPAAPQPVYLSQQYYSVAVTPPTNTLSVFSLISSILGWFLFGIFCVVGVVLGHISLSQIKRRGEGGKGMAITGLVIGYIGIAGWIIGIVLMIAFLGLLGAAAATSGSAYTT